ncbi:hypothetical protein [Acidimangrovimonas pyrenivorans]|uniref:Thioredoxin family protein n=1 Tax=Acidimangrovimonas pyrenivorans TaxID=2030798 RepID=A0ABV7AH65_9RHOB
MRLAFRSVTFAILAGLGLAFVAAFTAQPTRAQEVRRGVELVMFEQTGCHWCAQWNAQIGPIYGKTDEGKAAPLHRVDIHGALPSYMQLARKPQFTPTFVVLQDGVEIGRIEGYPGEDFFWGLLDQILTKTDNSAAGAAAEMAKS